MSELPEPENKAKSFIMSIVRYGFKRDIPCRAILITMAFLRGLSVFQTKSCKTHLLDLKSVSLLSGHPNCYPDGDGALALEVTPVWV